MVKLLINPFTYVANLSVLITCWLYIKFAVGQSAPIWLDKIMLVITCLILLLLVLSSLCGKIFLLRSYSIDAFKNRKIIDDLIHAICDRNPIKSFNHLKVSNYQFRELLLKNLDLSIRRKIDYFDRNEILYLTNKITSALLFAPEIDLKERLLNMIETILGSFDDILIYERYKSSVEMLKDLIVLQIKYPTEKRQNITLKIIEVLKFLKFEEDNEKWIFEDWKQHSVELINLILEPFEFKNDNALIIKEDMKAKLQKEIVHISNAYVVQKGNNDKENIHNLKRLCEIKEKLVEYKY